MPNPMNENQSHQCGARTRQGGTCRKPPVPGATRCRLHGGASPRSLAAAERRLAQRDALGELDQLRQLGMVEYGDEQNPVEVLAEQLREAHVNVAALRVLVGELGDDLTTTDVQRRPHVKALVDLYGMERDRLARLAEVAVKLGLEERRVRLGELVSARLAQALDGAMGDAGLTDDQVQAIRLGIARRLRDVG